MYDENRRAWNMKYTSASANKMIRFLEDRKNYLLQQESNDSRYVLAEDEKASIRKVRVSCIKWAELALND